MLQSLYGIIYACKANTIKLQFSLERSFAQPMDSKVSELLKSGNSTHPAAIAMLHKIYSVFLLAGVQSGEKNRRRPVRVSDVTNPNKRHILPMNLVKELRRKRKTYQAMHRGEFILSVERH